MGSMVPGQPNFFVQIMAAYLDGIEKRRVREIQERELGQQDEDRLLRREHLKMEQQKLKLEELISKRQLGQAQFGAMEGTPARRTSLPGAPAQSGGMSVGDDGAIQMGPSVPELLPQDISLPHQQIDLGGGALVQPQTLEQLLFAGREKEIAKNAVPTGEFGEDYFRGMPYLDARLPIPQRAMAAAPQPGVIPGQVYDVPALTASTAVMNDRGASSRAAANETGEASRAGMANALGRDRLGLDRERLAHDKATAGAGGAAQVKADVKMVQELPEKVTRAETLVKTLQAAKEAHAQLSLAGPVMGRLTPDTSGAAQRLRQARAVILTRSNPLKGQGQVSNFERQLAEGTVPNSSVDIATAGPIFDRLIEEAQTALELDREALTEAQQRRMQVGVTVQPGGPVFPGGPRRIASDAEYNALPSGAVFIGPDGQQRKKP